MGTGTGEGSSTRKIGFREGGKKNEAPGILKGRGSPEVLAKG